MTYSIAYAPNGEPIIVRSDGACVPGDLSNPDFRFFLAWNEQQQQPLDYTISGSKTRQRREISDILNGTDGLPGLGGLSVAQKAVTWNDFYSNQRWKQAKQNQAVLLLAVGLVQDGIIEAGSVNAKLWAVACLCQDVPSYLAPATFDGTINIPGDKPG